MTTTIEKRQSMERAIARQVITDALAAGYTLSVHNGEEITVKQSTNPGEILAAMMTVDEEHLLLRKGEARCGWIYFVYGNSGYDVICDYTVSLEPVLAGAEALAERMEDE